MASEMVKTFAYDVCGRSSAGKGLSRSLAFEPVSNGNFQYPSTIFRGNYIRGRVKCDRFVWGCRMGSLRIGSEDYIHVGEVAKKE